MAFLIGAAVFIAVCYFVWPEMGLVFLGMAGVILALWILTSWPWVGAVILALAAVAAVILFFVTLFFGAADTIAPNWDKPKKVKKKKAAKKPLNYALYFQLEEEAKAHAAANPHHH